MYLNILLVPLLLLAQASAQGVAAHHSTPVNFDQSKEITIVGVVTEIAWRNPHSRFRLDVTAEDGSTAEWLAEMGGINIMRRAGFPVEAFALGDRITITGNPGRRGRSMRLREVVLSDGTRLNEDSETSKYADDQERRETRPETTAARRAAVRRHLLVFDRRPTTGTNEDRIESETF